MTPLTWGRRTAIVLAVSATMACHRDDGPPSTGATARPVADPAVDHLAPGELIEGPGRAFELKLPAGVQVSETFASVVYAWGQVDPMQVANYLRAQVQGGTVSVGAAATVFDQVTTPANPKRLLRIRVDASAQGHLAHLEIRDVTPPPLPAASSTADRWRQLGLTPTGQLLDPSHLR